jgi:hypothetical protein
LTLTSSPTSSSRASTSALTLSPTSPLSSCCSPPSSTSAHAAPARDEGGVPLRQCLRLGLLSPRVPWPLLSDRWCAPPSTGDGQQWYANPHHRGYLKNKGKNKGYKPTAAPPVPTSYNSWTGTIQMRPMPQPASHGMLGPLRVPTPAPTLHLPTPAMLPLTARLSIVPLLVQPRLWPFPTSATVLLMAPLMVPPLPAQSWDTSALA